MTNLHPMIVHFPIALLTLYSALEIISVWKIKQIPGIFTAKAVLVIFGGLSLLLARQTGQITAHTVADPALRPLIRQHEKYANFSTAIFGIIAAGYCLQIFKYWLRQNFNNSNGLFNFIFALQRIVTETLVVKILALAGLAALLVTGALGGVLVYGQNIDPVAHFIYNWFF